MIGLGKAQAVQKPKAAIGAARPAKPNVGIGKGTPATGQAQPSNTAAVPKTQTEPINPFNPSNFTASKTPFAAPSYNAQSGTPDPRDSTYWENLSKLTFTDQQEASKIGLEQAQADTAYNSALQTAIKNRAVQERGLGESAIKGNLGASGWLNRTEGQQRSAYTDERAGAALSKSEEDQARTAARSALEQGFGIEAAAELAAAARRYGEGAGKASSTEEPELGGESKGATASSGGMKGYHPTGAAAGPFFGVKGNGGKKSTKGNGGTTAPANPKKVALGNAVKASKQKGK